MKLLMVGAGFSGAVLARELADALGAECLVIDTREHLGGNCHTERDAESNVMLHRYGPHIFNTSREDVWDYVRRFGEFGAFTNRVKASTDRGVFSLPINLLTINQFFGKRFSPAEAREFLSELGDQSIDEPRNFEEQALRMLGKELYYAFFYGYTKKQWGCEPKELPASILKRLPVRFNYDDNYYASKFQGIPIEGYSAIIERILDHDNVSLKLGVSYELGMESEFDHAFYSGSLDAFFRHSAGRLSYRTVYWEESIHEGDYQGNPVINYPGIDVPFTREIEHKHFAPWEEHEKTIVFREFSKATGPDDIPYYPRRLAEDKAQMEAYTKMVEDTSKIGFMGRLGTYRYLDMDQVIAESLDYAKRLAAVPASKWDNPELRFSALPSSPAPSKTGK